MKSKIPLLKTTSKGIISKKIPVFSTFDI